MSKSLQIQKKKQNLSADGWKDPRRFTSSSSTVTASVRTSASIKEHDPDTVWGLWLIFSLTLASRHGWLLLTDSLTTVTVSPLCRIKNRKVLLTEKVTSKLVCWSTFVKTFTLKGSGAVPSALWCNFSMKHGDTVGFLLLLSVAELPLLLSGKVTADKRSSDCKESSP